MTDQEFREAITHQTHVLDQIHALLTENKMSLAPDDGLVWLCDDGRDIGNTGYSV